METANNRRKTVAGGEYDRTMFEDNELEPGNIRELAIMLNLLAFNNAIASSHIGWRGKPAAVCADDIRNLAYELAMLFDKDGLKKYDDIAPMPKDCITTAGNCIEFMLLNIAGIPVVESLSNIKEICMGNECTDTHLKLREMENPIIDGYQLLGKSGEESVYVILQTPWAEQNKTYAVTANVAFLFFLFYGLADNGLIWMHFDMQELVAFF